MKYQVNLHSGETFECDRFLSQVNSDKEPIIYFHFGPSSTSERVEPSKNVASITPIAGAVASDAPAQALNGPVTPLNESQASTDEASKEAESTSEAETAAS